jgi:hypothetical protein
VPALVAAGATYYSDGFAVLDEHGRVHPYPTPLLLRGEGEERPTKVSAGALGGRPGRTPLRVGLIVIAEFRPGARWRARVLSPGQAVLALLPGALQAHIDPGFTLRTLQRVASGAPALKGRYGDAAEMVTPLLEILGRLAGAAREPAADGRPVR